MYRIVFYSVFYEYILCVYLLILIFCCISKICQDLILSIPRRQREEERETHTHTERERVIDIKRGRERESEA